jgi:hypothetical protein
VIYGKQNAFDFEISNDSGAWVGGSARRDAKRPRFTDAAPTKREMSARHRIKSILQ